VTRSALKPTLLVASLLFVVPSAATADTINYLGPHPGSAVTVAGIRSGTFLAGELHWEWDSSGIDLYTYCVDIMNNMQYEQEVSVGTTDSISGAYIAPDGGGKAAWLFNSYAAVVHGNSVHSAALQVAIWEALYDSSWDLAGGNFILKTTGAIQMAAYDYLKALYGNQGSYFTSTTTWLNTNRGQDQITRRSVPEPSVVLLFACGLLLLVCSHRVNAKRQAAGRASHS
jgi:hypothetical protein